MVSPQTAVTYYGHHLAGYGDTLLYFENALVPQGYSTEAWACNDFSCWGVTGGPIMQVCSTITITTNGLPTTIDLKGMEGGGNPLAGCPMTVNLGCYQSQLSVTASAANPTVYLGYAPLECTDLTATPASGSGSYSYLWDTGATTPAINVCPLQSTHYHVTITDNQSGCQATTSVDVDVENVVCGNGKTTVCYRNVTRCVRNNRVSNYLNRGGTVGACTNSFRRAEDLEDISTGVEVFFYQSPDKLEVGLLVDEEMEVEARLFSMDGKQMIQPVKVVVQPDDEGEVVIHKSSLPDGLYILHLSSRGEIIKAQKILIGGR
jgi:hypothetical protein